MREFIHYENIRHYIRLLAVTTDPPERGRIMNLMAEELVKELKIQRAEKVEISDENGSGGSMH
jgi:hypothetical protein